MQVTTRMQKAAMHSQALISLRWIRDVIADSLGMPINNFRGE